MHALPAEDPRNIADFALRKLWRHAAPELAQLALGKRVKSVEARDPAALAVGRAPDALALVTPAEGSPCTMFLEFEAAPREVLARRMALNTFLLHGTTGPPVRGVALVLEPPTPALDGRYDMTHDGQVLASCTYAVVNLADLSPEALLDAGTQAPGLLALVALCRNATLAQVGRAARTLAASQASDATELHAIAFVLAGRNFGYDQVRTLFTKETLMRSSTWEWIRNEAYNEGIEAGIEKGVADGVARGRHKGERAMVTRTAELRGGPDLAALVAQVPDDALPQALTVLVETQDSGAARTALLALTPPD